MHLRFELLYKERAEINCWIFGYFLGCCCFSFFSSQQQNALGYNLSMQGIGDVAIDGPRLEDLLGLARNFLRSRKCGSRKGVSQ